MNANVLIEASAGTGKTQALGERLIALLKAGAKPEEIVALTFSRAAAGEIFERFVSLLAQDPDPRAPTLLRSVIATQHLSQIGTLDAFLMKIVRAFPLELGLQGELEMMDAYREGVETARLTFAILRRTDKATKAAFVSAFADAMNEANVRSFVGAYRDFIRTWHERVLAFPDAEAWGNLKRIFFDVPADVAAPDLAAAAARLASAAGNDKDLLAMADWVREGSFAGVKGLAKKFLEHPALFANATIDVTYNRKARAYGGEEAAAIRGAVRAVGAVVVQKQAKLARGVYRLISDYEKAYAANVRGKGRLVFADVPRLIASLPPEARLALEYRLDARLRAWALDEFQDTSREQWRAIAPFIEEAKQSDGEKSVFIVGDAKQAIYGWRNGDVTIFRRERASGAYALQARNATYRSGAAVVEAVNKVFAGGLIFDLFPTWESPTHTVARPDAPKGYVQVAEAAGRSMADFVGPVFDALQAVEGRKIGTAVLVRSNAFGAFLAEELKLKGIKNVVWEGESELCDTPALRAFLDLVQLADHPGDAQAYRHFKTTPLASALCPGGVPEAAELSAQAARAFTSRGLVRVFREARAALAPEAAWGAYTEERFSDFLRAASEFESGREPGARLSDFASYLAAQTRRAVAEPGKIKVMTIHRSKGLGFDFVVLPLYEPDALNAEPEGPLMGANWILPDPGARATRVFGAFADATKARRERVEQEALCTYYVAMTRAKTALAIVTQPPPKTATESVRFSDLVRAAITEPIGERSWASGFGDGEPHCWGQTPPVGYARGKREKVARHLPSAQGEEEVSAGSLFASRAAKRGTALHEAYAQVEWIDPKNPRTDVERRIVELGWTEAFVKKGSADVVWRERAFEFFKDGRWMSGQFDRVVFSDGRAHVYDFKTNAPRAGETRESFAERLKETYFGQMAAYRAALASLTGLSPAAISLTLLTRAGVAHYQ